MFPNSGLCPALHQALLAVPPLEAINTATGIKHFVLTGIKRV